MDDILPQADGTYALTFKNRRNISDEEIREIFNEYGNVINVRKSSEQVPWVFVRYKYYEEALNAFKDLQNSELFDIRVANSGKKILIPGKGSDRKGSKSVAQDMGALKAGKSRKSPNSTHRENTDNDGRKNQKQKGWNRRFSYNLDADIDYVEVWLRNQTEISGKRKESSINPRIENTDNNSKKNEKQKGRNGNFSYNPVDDVEADFRNQMKITGSSRKFPKNSIQDADEEDQEIKRNGIQAAGCSRRFSKHFASETDGNPEERWNESHKVSDGPPKLVRATEFYGALTLKNPYDSVLASRAAFNDVWSNHPLRKEMELHEVVITNFDAIPTKRDIKRLCSGVTLLHISVDVTPKNMPYCRVLVATEDDAEKLYELDGCIFDGSPLYVSSLGYILDELAE